MKHDNEPQRQRSNRLGESIILRLLERATSKISATICERILPEFRQATPRRLKRKRMKNPHPQVQPEPLRPARWSLASRIFCWHDVIGGDRAMPHRGKPSPWDKLYASPRWRRLRRYQLLEHPLCKYLRRARPGRAGDNLRSRRAAPWRSQQVLARQAAVLVQALSRRRQARHRAVRISSRHRARRLSA